MRDPFPIAPPQALVSAVKPLADALSLYTLPLHAHEVLFAFAFYTFIGFVVSPRLSPVLAGRHYTKLPTRTKINWDVHVVSFVQSCIICCLSVYIILYDEERRSWRESGRYEERIWGYSGITGLCQSFALGYFLWDLWMCSWHVDIFGWGMLAHAVSATTVFSLGYRPFVYFYCPVFLLYELSSPFLNIHWFCDKLGLTGSVYQAVNGAFLTSTFFFCRICWGTYSSVRTFYDFYTAIAAGHSSQRPTGIIGEDKRLPGQNWNSGDVGLYYREHADQTTAFMGEEYLPLWLACSYLLANLTLNLLNIFWFSKMVQTIRKRFDPPWGTKGVGPEVAHWQPAERGEAEKKAAELHRAGKGSVKAARMRAEEVMNGDVEVEGEPEIQRGVYADGHKSIEVSGTTRRSGRSRRKA
ncbi:hypothetical protein LTR36_005753 [Oleoguttula mirabilis]|uniref:TLC domain-containing protein n=1 Tax=Oleoguttula mirabilis TaxID=1507867 RepID=A0AAV9JD58_9PEZI|nr:hypothetical protein LTR36_005753 [Oleoguttula mirabilis]